MANVKKRLDVLLVERGLAESRQRAQAVIMSGQVYVREQKVDKAGTQVEENAPIEVRGQALAYVSRGGLKLEKALKTFSGIRLKGVHAIDAGASTGGFTDCMLQNGAEKVYAVDVGYGQLAWSLRSDPRADSRAAGLRYSGCVLYLLKADFTRPTGYPKAGRTGSLSGEAPV